MTVAKNNEQENRRTEIFLPLLKYITFSNPSSMVGRAGTLWLCGVFKTLLFLRGLTFHCMAQWLEFEVGLPVCLNNGGQGNDRSCGSPLNRA